MNKKLKNKIQKQLTKLEKLLDNIAEAQIINSHDEETWDSDTLYNLIAQLKEALQLLADQTSKTKKDEFGQPLIIEEGLCSLIDEYQSEEEEDYD